MLKPALAAAFVALLLSACVSVLPEPTIPKALIRLPADRAVPPTGELKADIAVLPPDASRAYSGVDIAVSNDQELIYLPDVRWADASPRLLQGAVVASLSRAQGPGRVTTAQQGARVDYDLVWRIADLSVGKDTTAVHVVFEASLLDAATRRIVSQKRIETGGSPRSRDARDRAAQLADAVQKAADQIAQFVVDNAAAKTLAGAPAAPR